MFDEFGTELKLACAGDMWMDCMASVSYTHLIAENLNEAYDSLQADAVTRALRSVEQVTEYDEALQSISCLLYTSRCV